MALGLAALLVTIDATRSVPVGAAPPCSTRRYMAPVPDPVSIGFSLPQGQYGPGNRGLEYVTPPDRVVRAIGPGEVTFAGTVAGERHVSVRHPDGLISSYSYLASIAVTKGQPVNGGHEVGRSGGRFQLGIRREGVYLDPAPLLARKLRPRLVGPTPTARCTPPAAGYTFLGLSPLAGLPARTGHRTPTHQLSRRHGLRSPSSYGARDG